MTVSRSDADGLPVLYEESRAVLDHQIELVRSIDEKAMWLVRTAVIVISVVLSGAGIAGRQFLAQNWAPVVFASLGISALLFVSTWGSVLFAVSRVPFGPGQQFRTRLLGSDIGKHDTYRLLIRNHDELIATARREVGQNASAFTWLQVGFVGGVFLLTTSGLLIAVSTVTGSDQLPLLALGGTLTGGVVLYTVGTNFEVTP